VSRSPNKLLAALPGREYQRIAAQLRTVSLAAETALPHCGQTRVYFPGTALCSILNEMTDGSVIEIACVGSEGLVGLRSLAGECPVGQNAFVQVADGTSQYMPMVLFERELAKNGDLRRVVDRYCQLFLQGMIQSVACNRLHSFQERCSRWLLGAHDRLGRGRFELKARFLARAMGVRNSEVAKALMSLEQVGVIKHDATSVTVLDAVGLRRLACRCYEALKRGGIGEPPATEKRKRPASPHASARILSIRPGVGACTLCGLSTRAPHKSDHECILALDEEIGALTRRSHTLRKYRAQLLADRTYLFRDMLNRSSSS
jgi:hypothetical protein